MRVATIIVLEYGEKNGGNFMKAVTIDHFGGVDEMHWSDLPTPEPKGNEVQIEVAYTSVNPVDWKIREGRLQDFFPYQFPIIPGWDAAGTISALGDSVENYQVGDEIYSYCRKPTVQWGTYAQYVCMNEKDVALKPETLSFAEAASIPLVGLTAWQGLFDNAKLQKGQSILIHAGAGGVGSMAIQFAKVTGAKVYTTASREKHDYVKSLGADVAIDYKVEDFVEKMRELEPDGVNAVYDCVGGEALEKSFDIVKEGGRLISVVSKVDSKKTREKNIFGTMMIVSPNGAQLKEIAKLFDRGKLKPPHLTELSLDEFTKAHQMSQDGHTKGKIVLRVK